MASSWCIAPGAVPGERGLPRRGVAAIGPARPGLAWGGACGETPIFQKRSPLHSRPTESARGGRARPSPPCRRQVAPTPAGAARHFLANFFASCFLRQSCWRRPPVLGRALEPAGHARLPAPAGARLGRRGPPAAPLARGGGAMARDCAARSLDGIDLAALRVRTAGELPCGGGGPLTPGSGLPTPLLASAACARLHPALSACRRGFRSAARGGSADAAGRLCGDRGTSVVVAGTAGRWCPCPHRQRRCPRGAGCSGEQPRGRPGSAASGLSRSRSPRAPEVALPSLERESRGSTALPGWERCTAEAPSPDRIMNNFYRHP